MIKQDRDFNTFRHIHSVWHHEVGSVTLALLKHGDVLHIGCSVCSPKDNFDKRKGRELAESHEMTLQIADANNLLELLTLKELVFYALRANLPLLEECNAKQRWRKALGILAWELDLNDFGRGERPNNW